MKPDPAAVRAALAEIDEACAKVRSGKVGFWELKYVRAEKSQTIEAAARAWLAEQEASE